MIRSVSDGFQDYREWATDPTPRIGPGLPFFDKPTRGGIAKAECCMVLAYSSVGKTSVALNWIVANPHIPTMFFSIEMSWRLVTARLAAIDTGTPTWELEELLKHGAPVPQLQHTANKYQLLYGEDASEMSVKDMKSIVIDAGRKLGKPIRLIIIDYLELIGGAGMLGKSEAVDRAAVKVRALAKDTDSSVILLHQVAKGDGSEGHLPLSLDSGKYGGHQPMDYVIGAYAPRLNRKLMPAEKKLIEEELYLQLLKNRSGVAHSDGVKHRLDRNTGLLTEWGQTRSGIAVPAGVAYQAPLGTRPEPEFDRDLAS